jgi:hypothetical protein
MSASMANLQDATAQHPADHMRQPASALISIRCGA